MNRKDFHKLNERQLYALIYDKDESDNVGCEKVTGSQNLFCTNCIDISVCTGCVDCINCFNCIDCHNCINCSNIDKGVYMINGFQFPQDIWNKLAKKYKGMK